MRRVGVLALLGWSLLGCPKKRDDVVGKDPTPAAAPALPRAYHDVALASSTATKPVPTEGLRVFVGRRGLALTDGGSPLIVTPDDTTHGYAASAKVRGVESDLELLALRDAVPALAAAGGGTHDTAILYVDRATSYRILVEVVFTLGQRGFARYDFVVQSKSEPTKEVAIEIEAPRVGVEVGVVPSSSAALLADELEALDLAMLGTLGGKPSSGASVLPASPPPPPPGTCGSGPLRFTVIVLAGGLSVKAYGANLVPGCATGGAGLTIPSKDGVLDADGLARCAYAVKTCSPAYAKEKLAQLTANPSIPFHSIVTVADAIRDNFPELVLSILR